MLVVFSFWHKLILSCQNFKVGICGNKQIGVSNMEKKIFFEDARTNVLEFFSIEFPTLNIASVDAFISLFYKLVNYEEESQKIRPTILITSNVNLDTWLRWSARFLHDRDTVFLFP